MIQILCCWELGGGLGHLYRLRPVARELRRRGFSIAMAVKDLRAARGIFQNEFDLFQAPLWPKPTKHFTLSLNYAQNLLRNGYYDPVSLEDHLNQWISFFARYRPQIVLADHAPTALLAAEIAGIKRICFGPGFFIPPQTSPMPSLQPWFPIPKAHLRHIETEFLDVLNPIISRLGGTRLRSVGDIYQEATLFLCTFPEFDHYGERNGTAYCGPILQTAEGEPPPWPSSHTGRALIYLSYGYPHVHALLRSVTTSGFGVIAHIRGLPESKRGDLESHSLRISPLPMDLGKAIPEADLVIAHGGSNTGSLALLSGKPLLVIPSQLEQAMWGYRVAKQNLAAMTNFFSSSPDFSRKLEEIRDSADVRKGVSALARKYRGYNGRKPVEMIVDACASLL